MIKKHLVSVVKCNSYDNNETRIALETSLKNIDFKFKKNIKVLIKPNILGPHNKEQAITTHPIILEEICKILKKYNAKIYIGDSSGLNTEKSLEVSGIKRLSKYGKVLNFDELEKKYYEIGKEKNIPLPDILFNVDLIINVPKLKTHGLTGVTLCVKNLYGCIQGKTKSFLHIKYPSSYKFSRFLFELENKIKPELNIIDGIIGIEGEGPGTAGTPIKSNTIIAGTNPYATDIIASKIMGFDPFEIYTNKFSRINIKEIEVLGNGKDYSLKFKKPHYPFIRLFLPLQKLFPKPKITFNKDKCTKCLLCEEKCPVKAIKINPVQTCNHKKCIHCLCCIEVCPNNAINLEEHWTKKFLKKIIRRFRR